MTWFILIPIALGLGLTGLGAFLWALHHDQYGDLEGDAGRILIAPDTPISHKDSPNRKPAAIPEHTSSDRRL